VKKKASCPQSNFTPDMKPERSTFRFHYYIDLFLQGEKVIKEIVLFFGNGSQNHFSDKVTIVSIEDKKM